MASSAAGLSFPVQMVVYALALGMLIYVLVAPTLKAKADDHGGHDGHGAHAGVMRTIAYSVVSAGSLAFLMHMMKQPIILGYLLGGALIGPIGLRIITKDVEIHAISEIGLVFLLFMIGLELNVAEMMQQSKQVIFTGGLQFPTCMAMHVGLFQLLGLAGLSVGSSQFAVLYMSACCALSSSMIVVKLLQNKQETDTHAGKITIGILHFQGLWAIAFLAMQPNLANPHAMGILRSVAMMGLLVAMSFAFSRLILPPVLKSASAATELMLVLSLTWCFFVCCCALLDWVNLSMELAALIAGMSMASFPFSAELNGKIKYIRDFFTTLYFVALGMQIPMPTFYTIGMALVVCAIVTLGRWVGVFCTLYCMEAGARPSTLACINLTQISEFALVIAALGKTLDHIGDDTMTILIWSFCMLAASAGYLIGYNDKIYNYFAHMSGMNADRRRSLAPSTGVMSEVSSIDPSERTIVMLGCFTVGWELIDELERRRPEMLKQMVVVDFNSQLKDKFEEKGIAFMYGDISNPESLGQHENAQLVISTVPDAVLRGVTNMDLVTVAKKVWPDCQTIAVAQSVADASQIYEVGADYVLMISQLGAERLAEMLLTAPDSMDLADAFLKLEGSDNPHLRRTTMEEV